MKFLIDVNIEKQIIEELISLGHDVKCIAEIAPTMKDIDIFKLANAENLIIITNDKDFGEIVFRQNLISTAIVLIRVKSQCVEKKIELIKNILVCGTEKIEKHFVVLSENKIRLIKMRMEA